MTDDDDLPDDDPDDEHYEDDGLLTEVVFIGVLDDQPFDRGVCAFTANLGHALLVETPIVIAVPYCVDVPPKLLAVADRVVRYHAHNLPSLQHGVEAALAEMGLSRVQ